MVLPWVKKVHARVKQSSAWVKQDLTSFPFEDSYRLEAAGRALWRLRAVVQIEDNRLGSTLDTPGGRGARNAALVRAMAVYETEIAEDKDELDVHIAKAVAAATSTATKAKDKERSGKCYLCKKSGHIARDCPDKETLEQGRRMSPGNGNGAQRK